MQYKLFGLQRTCTNVVRWLIRYYLNGDDTEHGSEWKHGIIKETAYKKDVKIIVCTKDIHAWLHSIWSYFRNCHDGQRCPHHDRNCSLRQFIRNQHYQWNNPIIRWNKMNKHWLDFIEANPERGIVIKSEDLLTPEGQLSQLQKLCNFGFKWERAFSPILKRVNINCTLNHSNLDFDFYLQRKFMANYSSSDLKWVASEIDYAVRGKLYSDKMTLITYAN